jgi:hypothetical protein
MATEGLTIKNLLPIPDNIAAVMNPDAESPAVAHTIRDEPTDSHALAMAEPEEKGQAQQPHEAEVKDLGWQEPVSKIANPLVGGLPNEELWVLIRRFDKVSSTCWVESVL